ncbi:uncharacterized protein LOC141691239 [Apium graveolens]|uniref:uncharacterized protein LOC141691239 n=1 Tax=Apium graveolens TaxID=4045 RepID=UPI003D7B314C
MKQEKLILSTLISGPESPKNNIDVYMQPLITELKSLWNIGVEVYDTLTDENFQLRASVLWTISDFPGYAMLSGGSTKGKLACHVCNYETSSNYLKYSKKMCYMNHRKFLDPTHKWRLDKRRFNGEVEMGTSPQILSDTDIDELLSGLENQFGVKRKKKEKNIYDKILGTLLNIGGKTKDRVNARKDLQELGIRKPLHPIDCGDGKHLQIRAAIFDMTNKEKEQFCSILKNARLPYGCASNVSRYVHLKERKVMGYKSHDAHFILHYLLQFSVEKILKPQVALPMIKFGAFLRDLWSKVIDLDDLKRLQTEIVEVLCEFEMIFPQTFFDIMVHLLVHLYGEVEYGGLVHLTCMFSIEHCLGKLKSYIQNRSKPEGSIAEGYLAEECVTFCLRFLSVDDGTKNPVTDFRRYPANEEYHIGTKNNKDGKIFKLKDIVWKAVHRYVLFNSSNQEIETLMEEHRAFVDGLANPRRYKREREHTEEFWKWLKEVVLKRDNISRELEVFALGPNRADRKFNGYAINGFRFHTKFRDSRCTTQNGGVFLTAETTSFASLKDQNSIVGNVNYYGSIEEIFELDYWGAF